MSTNTSEFDEIMAEEEFESIADHHRMAAHHFMAAAKHHLAAAQADEEGNEEGQAAHAWLAYRHQLNGVQYAEIAAMDSDALEDEFDEPLVQEET